MEVNCITNFLHPRLLLISIFVLHTFQINPIPPSAKTDTEQGALNTSTDSSYISPPLYRSSSIPLTAAAVRTTNFTRQSE